MPPKPKRCPKCGRFIKKKNPRRSLPGNPEKKYHGHAGSNHSKDEAKKITRKAKEITQKEEAIEDHYERIMGDVHP